MKKASREKIGNTYSKKYRLLWKYAIRKNYETFFEFMCKIYFVMVFDCTAFLLLLQRFQKLFLWSWSNSSSFFKQRRIRYCVRRELTHQPEKGFAVFTPEFRPIFCFKIMHGTVGNAKKQPHFIIKRKSLYDVRIIDYRKRISEN